MSAQPAIFAADLPGQDDILRRELGNGIVILARQNAHTRSVVINGSLEAGAIIEPPDKQGLVNFLGSILSRGTTQRDFAAFHNALEGVGANLHLSGGVHNISFGGKALAEDLSLLLELLADAVQNPAFDPAQIERLRGELLTYLNIRQQNTRYMAGRRFREKIYPAEHPYHHSLSGTPETIQALTSDDLRAFHQQQVGPRGMIITVVGGVDPEEAAALVERIFGDWDNPNQQPLPALETLPPPAQTRTHHEPIPGKSQVDIALGVTGPRRQSADYLAARLANNILGVFGMYGRLGKNVREAQGLAYYSYSQLQSGLGPGPWLTRAGVDPHNVHQAVTSIRAEIKRMQDEYVPDDELADNQSNLVGSLPLRLEGNEGTAAAIYSMERHDLGLNYLRGYAAAIQSLTAEDVQRAVQTYWPPDIDVLATAGPDLPEETS